MNAQGHCETIANETDRLTALCPDCGGATTRCGDGHPHWACGDCGAKHRIDVMPAAVMQRQQSHLHRRGVDRLIAAILESKEA